MRARTRHIALSAVAALALAGCAADEEPIPEAPTLSESTTSADPTTGPADDQRPQDGALATATLSTVDGTVVGMVTFSGTDAGDGIGVTVEAEGMDEGFYGFHVHTTGLCEADSAAPDDPATTGAFLSAGGHLGADESDHSMHAGDLPSLRVTSAGTASLTTITDAMTVEDLLDDDGSAVMIHSGRDNFANIPERYAPDGPDQDTLDTGDAGDRLACGVVSAEP